MTTTMEDSGSARGLAGGADEDIDVIISGDSHIIAMGVPKTRESSYRLMPVIAEPIRISGVVKDRKNDAADKKYWPFLAENAAGRTMVIVWRGNQHNTAFLFAPNPLFDFVIQGSPDTTLTPGAVLVPKTVIRKHFEESLEGLKDVIRLYRSSGAKRVIVLGTPPVKGVDKLFLPIVRSSPHFTALAARRGVDVDALGAVMPAPIRQRLWLLLQNMLEDTAVAEGAEFLPVPTEMMMSDGTLKAEYWGTDVTHANAAYGRRMVSHLTDFILAGG